MALTTLPTRNTAAVPMRSTVISHFVAICSECVALCQTVLSEQEARSAAFRYEEPSETDEETERPGRLTPPGRRPFPSALLWRTRPVRAPVQGGRSAPRLHRARVVAPPRHPSASSFSC